MWIAISVELGPGMRLVAPRRSRNFSRDSQLRRFLYCLLNLAFISGGALLRRRVFVLYGAVGVNLYLGQLAYDPLAIMALPLGAIALGGSDGAMLLGHWYLVTPKLSPGPLRRAALVVVSAVALQIAVVAIVALRGDLTGTWQTGLSVALWLRIGVGLLMTLFVALAAWWTAGMNTQSSTGLLYVGLGCVIAGEVSARVIFFLTGVPL